VDVEKGAERARACLERVGGQSAAEELRRADGGPEQARDVEVEALVRAATASATVAAGAAGGPSAASWMHIAAASAAPYDGPAARPAGGPGAAALLP
jgi:hypothetical protein